MRSKYDYDLGNVEEILAMFDAIDEDDYEDYIGDSYEFFHTCADDLRCGCFIEAYFDDDVTDISLAICAVYKDEDGNVVFGENLESKELSDDFLHKLNEAEDEYDIEALMLEEIKDIDWSDYYK